MAKEEEGKSEERGEREEEEEEEEEKEEEEEEEKKTGFVLPLSLLDEVSSGRVWSGRDSSRSLVRPGNRYR